jgi:NitT/TauT family transport system substrate-binding protein
MLVCFGWSKLAIIIPTAIMISFPLTLNIYRGLNSVTKEFLEFFKIHRSHFLQILFYLRLPFALPQVFSGLRISISVAGVSAVAGEWAGGQEGLGLLIQESRRNADYTAIFGALVCLIVLSLVLYLGIYFIESLYQNYYLHINGTSKEN